MRKFTSTLVLSLITMGGAFAQVTAPTTKLSADQLKSSTTTTKRIFLKATSATNENWFTGEVSSATLSGKTLFELEKKDNAYVLKRLSTGNYIQPNEDRITLGAQNSAQEFELVDVPRDQITDGDLRGEVPYVRFKKVGKEMFLNVQRYDANPKFANGKGAWSFVNVYDATGYSLVTFNITKDGATTEVKQVYKNGDKIVAPNYEGYEALFTANAVGKDTTVNVKYHHSISYSESVLQTKGKVGYPVDSYYETLKSSIEKAKTESNEENYQALDAALDSLYKTTNVTLPTDGKTYVFTNHHKKNDGTVGKYYFTYDTNGLKLTDRASLTAQDCPMEAKFTCHHLEGNNFMLVNNQGKYLVFKGAPGKGTNSNKGFVETYDNTYCPMTIQKHTRSIGKELFGLVSFGGKRADENNKSNFVIKLENGNTSFDQTHSFDFYNDNKFSTLFQIEEVAYPNNPTLNPIVGDAVSIEGAKTIATFSAPFATTIPANVSAFYARLIDANTAQLEKITGNTVPANTGVILTSTTEGQHDVLMIPATDMGTPIQDNQLGNSAGADTTFTSESFYILGKAKDIVGFYKGRANTTLKMNKSYLKANAAATASVLRVIFGGNPGDGTTGIEGLEEQGISVAAPIYDLSGRRVATPVKGGLYIQNGKKIIVK